MPFKNEKQRIECDAIDDSIHDVKSKAEDLRKVELKMTWSGYIRAFNQALDLNLGFSKRNQ